MAADPAEVDQRIRFSGTMSGGAMVDPATARSRWNTALLLTATSLPFLMSLGFALARNRGATPTGDYALMDLQVRQAMRWQLALGVYDRFGWHHPGPAYLYLIAAVERFTGTADPSAAQFVTAAGIDLACSVLTVYLIRRRFGPRAGIAAAAALLMVVAAMTPNASSDPWAPNIVVLPLVLFGVVAAMAWSGSLREVSWCFVIGSFAVQTDLSTIPLVAIVGALTGGACLYRSVRRPRGTRFRLRSVALPAGLGILMWIPPLVQQLDGHPGNLSEIWRFFSINHTHPSWAFAVALAGSAAGHALGYSLPGLRFDPTPGQSEFAVVGGLVLVGLLACRLFQRLVLPVAAVAGLGLLAAVLGARQLVGLPWEYLLTWATVPAILAFLAGLVALSALPGRVTAVALYVVSCAALLLATTASARHSPKLSSPDVTAASTALLRDVPKGETVGLIGYDLTPLLDLDGVADCLSIRGRAFDVASYYHFEFPDLTSHPTLWAVLASSPREIPRGYRVVARTPDLQVAIGTTMPPGWN